MLNVLLPIILAVVAPSSEPSIDVVGLQDLESRFAVGGDTTYVVNFWATWCKPCIEELPAFDKMHRRTRTSTTKVLLVSLDAPEDLAKKVVPFVRKKGYTAEVVLMDEPKPNEWIDKVDESWSGAIPATLFVESGENGRRQFFERDFTFEELERSLNAFLKATKE